MTTNAQLAVSQSRIPADFDEDGFLIDTMVWTKVLAEQIAEFDGITPLTENHWKVIDHIRERFFRVGDVPALRLVCRATGLTQTEIRRLFGNCRAAWRIAGLPHPGEEAKAYF